MAMLKKVETAIRIFDTTDATIPPSTDVDDVSSIFAKSPQQTAGSNSCSLHPQSAIRRPLREPTHDLLFDEIDSPLFNF
jgi:hypothetical protein